MMPNTTIHRTSGKLRLPASGDFQRCRGRFAPATTGRRIAIRCLRGAKRRTTTRIKPTSGGKACGFTTFRGLSAAPLGVAMTDEDLSIAVWLPLQPNELDFLQTALRTAGVLVPGNYAGDDPYVLLDYLTAATVNDYEFRALFDRNLISPLVALAGGAEVPESSQAQSNTRLAAGCACFCILARILIEPNISLYEYAASSGNAAAQSDARLFRVADNTDALAYLDIAMNRADRLPPDLIEHLRSLPDIADREMPEKDYERSLTMWKPNYLYALKTVALRRAGLSSMEVALELIRWQKEEAFFTAPGGMYCIAAIAHKPPKGGMLKGILSANIASLRSGLRNAAWDMSLLQQFGRFARQPRGSLWSLWSTDMALREIAKALFVQDEESEQEKLIHFYERHWGEKDGQRLLSAYNEASAAIRDEGQTRHLRTNELLGNIDLQIKELELQLGLADA